MKPIVLGKIVAAHGVKGLVKILPLPACDDPSMMDGDVLTGDGETISITLKNGLGKYILAEIDGVTERNGAEAIRGTEICIPREDVPVPDKGFFDEDLIGRDVVEDGVVIGTVLRLENFGAEDLLDIRLKSGVTFYLPVRDDYVLEIGDAIVVQNHEEMIIG
ncbi:ribosome maturation factor RimM [Alphaproteobacteria bacterium]|nr:ribosome maturation factor RimM [Alphaproteobacteria bacterium]